MSAVGLPALLVRWLRTCEHTQIINSAITWFFFFFCLEHRTYDAHLCPKSQVFDAKVEICSACHVSVRNSPGLDLSAAMRRHKSTACDPSKSKPKPRCSLKGCKDHLTFSNRVQCKYGFLFRGMVLLQFGLTRSIVFSGIVQKTFV